MKCPIDNTLLTVSERNGIEIDYCPQCRGVWLDRGELDKIIERSNLSAREGDRSGYSDSGGRARKPKKKSSLLGDLFDF